MFTAKFSTLAENFLNHIIVSFVPINLCLHHEDRNILVKCLIVFRQGRVYCFAVSCNSSILNGFGLFTKCIDMFGRKFFKSAIGLFLRGLVKYKILQEFKITLRQTFVSQMCIFCKNICCQVVVLVLAVK